jgi:hypothetical protein
MRRPRKAGLPTLNLDAEGEATLPDEEAPDEGDAGSGAAAEGFVIIVRIRLCADAFAEKHGHEITIRTRTSSFKR